MRKILSEIGTMLIDVAIGVVIGIMIATILFPKFHPRSGPDPVKVIENPTAAQEKKADVVIREGRTGELISRVEVAQKSDPDPPGQEKKVLTLPVGEKFKAPAAGEVKTIYLDRSGLQIGEGVHQIIGETTVTVGDEWLDIKTIFSDSVTVAMDLPEPKRKLNHLGRYLVTDIEKMDYGGYYQRDWPFLKTKWVDVIGFYRYQVDWDRKHFAGIEGNF
jgi:hypothetical protein